MEDMQGEALVVTYPLVIEETCRGFDTVLAMTVKEWEDVHVVISSEFPEVKKRTEEYLKRFSHIKIIGKRTSVEEPYYLMAPDRFKGGA